MPEWKCRKSFILMRHAGKYLFSSRMLPMGRYSSSLPPGLPAQFSGDSASAGLLGPNRTATLASCSPAILLPMNAALASSNKGSPFRRHRGLRLRIFGMRCTGVT